MASPTEIIEAIEALSVHCRPPLMGIEERQRWLSDWCDDLRPYSGEAVQTGCARWRQGTNTKFPLPGQLLPLVRAANTTGGAQVQNNKPWRPLSDGEYAQLTLREKIRHQRILASEAFSKAGPQLTNREDMPRRWNDCQEEAQRHLKEVEALKKILAESKDRGEDAA